MLMQVMMMPLQLLVEDDDVISTLMLKIMMLL
jgi:hypothetical protein